MKKNLPSKQFRFIFALLLSSFTIEGYANDCTKIDQHVKSTMKHNNIAGIAIAIVTSKQTQFCNYGYTNKDKTAPITEKSIFEIASVTKTFTALLAAIAVNEKKLRLNSPITEYIPELAANQAYYKITTQTILTHVAGLPFDFTNKPYTESEFINALIEMKINKQPETYFEYSSPSISIAGLELSRIYGTTYEDLLKQKILNRLEMTDTSPNIKASSLNNLVTGYNAKGDRAMYINSGINLATGGLKSSSADLSKYLRLQIFPTENKEFEEPLKLVHTNYYCLYPNGTYQQLAWEYHPAYQLVEKFKPDPRNYNVIPPHPLPSDDCKGNLNGFVDKTGNAPGMSTYIGYIPHEKIGVVVLMNSAQKPEAVDLGRFVLQTTKQSYK